MSGSSFSGPSRKSKFRPQRPGEQRLPAPIVEEVDHGQSAAAEGEPAAAELPAGSFDAGPDLPPAARPRRPPVQERYVHNPSFAVRWRLPLLGLLLVVVGGGAGYVLGTIGRSPSGANKKGVRVLHQVEYPQPLTEEQQTQLDASYRASKAGHYADARQMFTSLAQQHPEWPKLAIDVSRTEIYQAEYLDAQKILSALMQGDSSAQADAFFLTGVMELQVRDFPDAESAFEAATAADPTQSEYYYFWGDCLRQEGKIAEAAQRFRSALYRNQYETAEDLLQLKVWLCDVALDQDKNNGSDAAIDAELTHPFPNGSALLAMAARSIKAGRFAEAAGFISRGRAAMNQLIFRIVMSDSTFTQEGWRPELAPFFAAAVSPVAPAASVQTGKAAAASPAPGQPAAAPSPSPAPGQP